MSSKFALSSTLADVGLSVRQARKSNKLTQTDLGKRAGVSRMPVYRIETGQDISLRTLLAILSALRLGMQITPLPEGPPTVRDLKAAFAHLHEEDAE